MNEGGVVELANVADFASLFAIPVSIERSRNEGQIDQSWKCGETGLEHSEIIGFRVYR